MEAQVLSNKLPHITEVKPLNKTDIPVMNDIYQVLKKHGALQRFGVTLLHDHFEVMDDEIMLELTNVETREQRLITVKRSDAELTDSIETSWRLDMGIPISKCRCDKQGSNHEHFEV